MKKTPLSLVILLLFAWALPLSAQQDSAGRNTPETPSFYKIRQQTLDQWGGKVPPRGHGYKQFKRWEYFWESRLLPDGSFPAPDQNEREWASYQQKHPETVAESQFPANWTSLGPTSTAGGYIGIGRINCIAFHPTNANIMWAGTPAGGLWKSVNGGGTWTTNTDNQPWAFSLGVSSIAIDPLNPNVMYIATGDKDKSTSFPYSVGILKSTDGGITWNPTGALPVTNGYFLVTQVLIHPTNSDILLAATTEGQNTGGAFLGGLYQSTDRGVTWNQVLSGDHFYDIKFKPGSSSIAYATSRNKFFRSIDGGENWSQIGNAIPGSGRIQIAVSANNPGFVALVSSKPRTLTPGEDGSFNFFYTSINSGGDIKRKYFGSRNLLTWDAAGAGTGGQGEYNLCITVSPTNANTIYIGGVNLWKSVDGGVTWALINYWTGQGSPAGVAIVHADKHCLAWQNNSTLFQGNDGGIYKSTNGGTNWTDLSNTLVISQLYRIGVSKSDNKIIAGLQDNGTKLKGTNGTWTDAIGGDGMECFIHPMLPNIMYGENSGGFLQRSEASGAYNSWFPINIPGNNNINNGVGAWVTPWAMDPNNSSTLYAGYDAVWKSPNEGQNQSWEPISPNLSNNTGDPRNRKLTSLAVAPSNSAVIYVATYNEIWRTTTGGVGANSWTPIIQGLPVSQARISYIAIDPANASKVYVTFSGYSGGNKVFKSINGGTNWLPSFSGTLPNVPANCITVQPGGNDALYVGTDIGVYYRDATMSDWIPFNGGLPKVIVTELECNTSTNKIIAATYGRGLWESNYQNGNSSNNLTVTPASQAASSNAGSATITIASNVSWTVTDNATWLTVSPTSGTGNASITANFTANTGASARTATITVTGGGFSPTATVVQAGVGIGGCNTPSGLLTQNILQTSAKFRWNAVSGALSYSVQYRQAPNGIWRNTTPPDITSTYITVGSLTPGLAYEWRMIANCANGTHSGVAYATFTTQSTSNCPTPDYLQTSNITQSTVIASWDPVPGASTYQLQTRIAPNGVWVDTEPAIFTTNTIFIYGFDNNTLYEWRVRANCGNNGSSPWADGIPFFTLPLIGDDPDDRSESNSDIPPVGIDPGQALLENRATKANNPSNALGMIVYPNPTSSVFNIQLVNPDATIQSVKMHVYDPMGNIMWEKSDAIVTGLNAWEVPSENWPSGVYVVRLLSAEGRQSTQKIQVF